MVMVVVAVAMSVTVVVMMSVAVPVFMPVRVIVPMHRLEARHDRADGGAEPFQHGADDVIALDQDAILVDLRRQMTVAEMPGEMTQRACGAGNHLVEFLLRCDDCDRAAVRQHQPIAIGEEHRFGQIDHDLLALIGGDELAAEMARRMVEPDGAGGLAITAMAMGNSTEHHRPQNRK